MIPVNAEILMMIGGFSSFLLTAYWVRTRDLREKYAVVWLSVALLILLAGLFPNVLMEAADQLHLSYPSAVLFVVVGVIYMFAFFVTVGMTRQYRRNVRLTQEIALLESRLRALEDRLARGEHPAHGEG